MLLAIDVGNTNLVFAVADTGVVKAQWRAASIVREAAERPLGPCQRRRSVGAQLQAPA